MGRQAKLRSVDSPPRFFRFVSEDSPTAGNRPVTLHLDEYEALRLADGLGYDHAEAGEIMDVSRPTFTRLLKRARKKMALFLTDGGSLEITGGQVLFAADVYCCTECHRPFPNKGGGPPRCSRCGGDRVIRAQPSCHHDCRCCEAMAGC
jgi:predicted DNA-binding protein (UPF0251 family)